MAEVTSSRSIREAAEMILAALDAGTGDDLTEAQSQVVALRAQVALTTHPDKGAIEIRTCTACTQPFPEWAGMVALPCPSCRVQSVATRTIRHDTPADEAIAIVAHEAMSAHRTLHDRSAFPRWEKAPVEHTAELVAQVRAIRANEVTSAETSHEAWMTRAKLGGWKYAPAYDVIARTDPSLRLWAELTPADKENRQLFVSVVHTLIGKS